MSERECLQCGETPASIRRQGITLCGIMEGYETRELAYEFPRHRWADWSNKELTSFGIKPEAFYKHRRTPWMHLQWAGCEDLVGGHRFADDEAAEDLLIHVGDCVLCGYNEGEKNDQ